MLDINVYLKPEIQKLQDGTNEGWISQPGRLSQLGGAVFLAPGDKYTFELNFATQITEVYTAEITKTNTAPTRDIDAKFQWSQDGINWSIEYTYDDATILAQTSGIVDPDLPLYFRLIFTRTGDPGDFQPVFVTFWKMNFRWDPTKIPWFGLSPYQINQSFLGITPDLKWSDNILFLNHCAAFINSVFTEIITRPDGINADSFTGRPIAGVIEGHPEKCITDFSKIWMYYYDITRNDNFRNTTNNQTLITARVGLKRDCGNQLQNSDVNMQRLKTDILQYFGANWISYTYQNLYGGKRFIGCNFYHLGIREVRIVGQAEREVQKCGCTWWECVLEFRLQFPVLNDFLYL